MTRAWGLVRLVPLWMWGAAIGLLVLPFYLAYFSWALGACGAVTFMPRT